MKDRFYVGALTARCDIQAPSHNFSPTMQIPRHIMYLRRKLIGTHKTPITNQDYKLRTIQNLIHNTGGRWHTCWGFEKAANSWGTLAQSRSLLPCFSVLQYSALSSSIVLTTSVFAFWFFFYLIPSDFLLLRLNFFSISNVFFFSHAIVVIVAWFHLIAPCTWLFWLLFFLTPLFFSQSLAMENPPNSQAFGAPIRPTAMPLDGMWSVSIVLLLWTYVRKKLDIQSEEICN